MNFIKKIFTGQVDSLVHLQFQKFSRGEFRNRALISAKKSKDKYSISTSSEFANDLVRDIAQKLGERKTGVTGVVVSTSDLTNELEFKNKKQFQGVKSYVIENEMSGNEIINLLDKFPKAFFALSFSADNTGLKIKPKAPKSGKPGKGDEAPKADFCKITTTDSEIGRDFVFEGENFSKANINHIFVIEKIVIPEELKDEKDFAVIREKSLRKGKIIRESEIDGEKTRKEIEFEA